MRWVGLLGAVFLLSGCTGIENPLAQETVLSAFRDSGLLGAHHEADYLGRSADGRPILRPLLIGSTSDGNNVVAAWFRSNAAAARAVRSAPEFVGVRVCNVWLGFNRRDSHTERVVMALRRKCAP